MNLDIVLGWPEWILLVLMILNVCATAILHGRPRTGKYNVFAAFAGFFIQFWILYEGGFFS